MWATTACYAPASMGPSGTFESVNFIFIYLLINKINVYCFIRQAPAASECRPAVETGRHHRSTSVQKQAVMSGPADCVRFGQAYRCRLPVIQREGFISSAGSRTGDTAATNKDRCHAPAGYNGDRPSGG